MTMLLLDAGNTRLKWILCKQGQFVHRGSFAYQWPDLTAQFQEHWGPLTKTITLDKVVLSCVTQDQLGNQLQGWLQTHWNQASNIQEKSALTIEGVVAQVEAFGVRCAYQQPAQLGADRWAALVAARHHLDGPSCVIDCGTALTIDLLTADGVHAGGLIAPGMGMMRDSLVANTCQIPAGEAVENTVFTVQDTLGAVQAGIMAATVGAVRQVLQQCRDQWQQDPVCVVTGGDAESLLAAMPAASWPNGVQHEVEWVLKGLAIIAGCHQ